MKHVGLQSCIMCCLDRRLISSEPLVKNYDMLFLQCTDCKSVVRLVYRQRFAEPRNKASGWQSGRLIQTTDPLRGPAS